MKNFVGVTIAALITVAIVTIIVAPGGQQQSAPVNLGQNNASQTMQAPEGANQPGNSGQYITYSSEADLLANVEENENRVLFFKADWCITCNALDQDIQNNRQQIPVNMTIVQVDFDEETELRQRYDVRHQHTMVRVDNEGNKLDAWLLSPDLESLVSRATEEA